jgi:hypothetical protein
MAYRRRKGSTAWHFCRNCSNWPTSNYEKRKTPPSHENRCNECRGKKDNDNCRQ